MEIHQQSVLIVEDSETQALRLQIILEEEGWNVSVATSGEEALDIIDRKLPDLLVVDYYLPNMRGDQLCQLVRANRSRQNIPILMLTSEEAEASEMRGLASGADSYVSKSEDIPVLLARLRALARKARPALARPRARVLAIDDSPTYLTYLAQVLEVDDYDIQTASNGTEGLEMVQRSQFDCILVDLVMPDISGTEVCRRLTEMRNASENAMVILMLTSSESKEDMTRGLEAGADDFVGKGSDVAVLRARIQALLRRKFLQDANQRGIEELKNRELQEKNQELAAALAEAREATAMKSRFLAGMSHELRTPLNGIIGLSQLLHDDRVGLVNDRQRDFLADILASSHHLLQLINDILDMAKIEAGKMEFYVETVILEALVAEVVSVLRPMAEEKRIAVTTELSPECPEVEADPARLRQVLYNYLSNALKFTEPEGNVTIRVTSEDSEHVRIAVADTGIGINAEGMKRLFRDFEQIRSAGLEKQKGTGLGLSLTKRIMEAQGGRVEVASKVGTGSVFSAVLPLRGSPAEGARPGDLRAINFSCPHQF